MDLHPAFQQTRISGFHETYVYHTLRRGEANVSFIPEKVLQSLNNFIDVCMNQAFDYALAYIPDTDEKEDSEASGKWREKCYERNAEIKEAFETFQSDLNVRMDELKKGE